MPEIIFDKVDLPEPFKPIIPIVSPEYTSRLTPFNAQNVGTLF